MKNKRYRYTYSYDRFFDADRYEGVIDLDVFGELHPEACLRCVVNFLMDHFACFTFDDAVDIVKSLCDEESDDEE